MSIDGSRARRRVGRACVRALVVALALVGGNARADGEPDAGSSAASATSVTSVTVHQDGTAGPLDRPLATFFAVGEPLAYVDWLCLGANGDRGPTFEVELSRIAVLDEDGRAVGAFTSGSGNRHRFRAYAAHDGDRPTQRYCTRVLPRAWGDESVRFVATRDAARVTRVAFAWDGDARGCEGSRSCGSLTPRFTGFTYGAAATRFTFGSLGFYRTAELDDGVLRGGVTRFRAAAMLPLLYITAGSPTALRLSAQAGIALPLTLASTSSAGGGGSALGIGVGSYWAQCLELRTPVAPNVCVGAQIDGAVEGALRGGALDDVRPRLLFSWFVALGLGH